MTLSSGNYLTEESAEVNSFYELSRNKFFSWKGVDVSTPVVVLKMEHYGSLGIIRSLGRLGIRVFGTDKYKRTYASSSRYCKGSFCFDVETSSEEKSLSFLLELGEQIGQSSILIPTSDESALFVARCADQLRGEFIFPEMPGGLVESLCSKKKMYSIAIKNNIPVPESFFPENVSDVLDYSEKVPLPVLLKGIDGGKLERETGKKMMIVKDKSELIDLYRSMENHEEQNLMIQEYIPQRKNNMWIFNGYFGSSSDCLAAFTGIKLRQNPVYTGMTSLGICQWNKTLSDLSTTFMKDIGYKGIVDIDYILDPRDGKYKILDINPRVGASFRLFVGANGEDVIRTMYLDLTSQKTSFSFPPDGRKWMVEDKDIYSSYNYIKDKNLKAIEWLLSFKGLREAGYFALDDPQPALLLWLNHLKKRLIKVFNKNKKKSRNRIVWRKLL